MLKISFDAMGGDHAPEEIVKGALMASHELKIYSLIVGDEKQVNSLIEKYRNDYANAEYEVVPSFSEIPMGDKNPAKAIRKKDSSLVIANQLVADGKADAVVSAGNTGAATAASLFILKRIKGFERPCICSFIPTTLNKMLLVDAGSNITSTAKQLVQNAYLGNLVSKALMKKAKPKIGLLNIGEEPGKGIDLYKEAYELLEAESTLEFVGNVEGKTIINDICDVVICDGFVGNIHLKSLEGGLKMMSSAFKNEFKSNPITMLAGLLMKLSGAFKRIHDHFSPSSYGGALLGGLQHVSMISHGSSDAEAIKNAAKHAKMIAEAGVIKQIQDHFENGTRETQVST
jgi:glycerol-3-phosphate acyltransferase PlsX